MKKKDYFYGKYYKFVSIDGYSFAIIDAYTSEGHSYQLVTKEKSYLNIGIDSIVINNDEHEFIFNINNEEISIIGTLKLDTFHPLKRKVMGPFTYLPLMECKHDIYSMYHSLKGYLSINGDKVSFDNGYGYIEGDKGVNFPKNYIWYNSVIDNIGVTLAIATIPYGLISFTGLLCFIKNKDKDYYLSTYNLAKINKKIDNEIVITKGKYKLIINIPLINGHNLKAPVKGSFTRYIKEGIGIPSTYTFFYKDKVLLSNTDPSSSIEWMY